jgi:large conductance mechanosensitive channel
VADTKSIATEFKEFLLRGNVVDLAVAVVIGAAFGRLITAFVEGILTPLIGAIFGEPNFGALTFTINDSHFFYGNVLNAVFSFVAVAAAIFFFVVKPLNYLLERRKAAMAAGAEPEPETLSDEALLLSEIRDLLRTRQG